MILFKCADYFVDGAIAVASILRIPKMIVGIVLVGLATTAPEFGVSVMAAFLGNLEISLGNAIGSVICDDGVALALAAVVAPGAILVNCRILKTVGIFLIGIDVFAYALARNGTLGRIEGASLVMILVVYYSFILANKSFRTRLGSAEAEDARGVSEAGPKKDLLRKPALLFLGGIAGVLVTSRIINWAAVNIAAYFSISETVIGLTVVAIGTSLPEISTCITAGLKGEGELAVGNIIGADILNILWIIGVSSMVRPIQVELKVINFTFPFMILIVLVMLLSMRIGCSLNRIKGLVLFSLYLIYLFLTLLLFT